MRVSPARTRLSIADLIVLCLSSLLLCVELVSALGGRRWDTIAVALLCCVGSAAGAWRPRLATAALCLGMLGASVFPPALTSASVFAPPVAVVAQVSSRRMPVAVLLTGAGYATSMWLSRRAQTPGEWLSAGSLWGVIYAAAWLTGFALRWAADMGRRELDRELELQRRTIAAELHDRVAHDLAMIVVTAEAARGQGVGADDVLERIAGMGRGASTQLREMMALLRLSERLRPQTAQGELERARKDLAGDGRRLNVTVDGRLDDLPSGTSDVLAKILREGFNNMARHATAGSPCSVFVRRGDTHIEAILINGWDGRCGSGLGIAGMVERATAASGTLTAEGRGETWVVDLVLPLSPA